jgi:hypothetical protein
MLNLTTVTYVGERTMYSPWNPVASTIASATLLMLTSSSSSTEGNNSTKVTKCQCLWKDANRIGKMSLTAKGDWLDVIVLSQHPDKQLGEVVRVDKLTERLACARNDEGGVMFCRVRHNN